VRVLVWERIRWKLTQCGTGNEANGGYLCGTTGHTCSSGDWRQAYANYLVQYVKYYNQAGIPITHLGFLNEPDYV
jgi:hypothetical protein